MASKQKQRTCDHDYEYVRKEGTSFLYVCLLCDLTYWQEEKFRG